jgi:hypothetical protein
MKVRVEIKKCSNQRMISTLKLEISLKFQSLNAKIIIPQIQYNRSVLQKLTDQNLYLEANTILIRASVFTHNFNSNILQTQLSRKQKTHVVTKQSAAWPCGI